MGLVRINNDGKQLGVWSRRVGTLSAVIVACGALWFVAEPTYGIYVMLLGNSLASCWNLADDS
jgi:hypothetical protein